MRILLLLACLLFVGRGEAQPPERFTVPQVSRGEPVSDVLLPADVVARPDETPAQAIARALHGDEGATARSRSTPAGSCASAEREPKRRSPASKRAEDDLDWRTAPNALNAELTASDAPEGAATFTWSFDALGRGVSCSLDADGDGELDYRLQDCASQNRLTHRFPAGDQGEFFATLLARSEDGRTGLARARVSVR